MYEKVLADKLKRIFDLKKVTFDSPGTSAEQDTIFIEIDKSHNLIKDSREIARATGKIRVFSQNKRMPFGYLSKQIENAQKSDVISFFFFNLEENSARFLDTVERSANFVFFFNEQYDPEHGEINDVQINVEVIE